MRRLKRPDSRRGGRAAVVVPNGTLYEQGIAARIRETLIRDFTLQAVLRLPKGVFEPYTDIQTNVLFFEAGEGLDTVWFYEHPLPPHRAHLRGKSYSASDGLQYEELVPFLEWLRAPRENDHAWTIPVSELAVTGFDLALTHPNTSAIAIKSPDDVADRLRAGIRAVTPATAALTESLEAIGVSRAKLAPLRQVLLPRRKRLRLADDVLYTRPRVQLHFRGALVRDNEYGRNIGSKTQTVMATGDLIVSRIDARNGAMAIVPPELDGAIATNDFPLFQLDLEQIDPGYLRFALFQPSMVTRYEKASRGSTNRRRLDVPTFLELEIPLPDLSEQRSIASQLSAMQIRLQDCRAIVEELSTDLDDVVPSVLTEAFSAVDDQAPQGLSPQPVAPGRDS